MKVRSGIALLLLVSVEAPAKESSVHPLNGHIIFYEPRTVADGLKRVEDQIESCKNLKREPYDSYCSTEKDLEYYVLKNNQGELNYMVHRELAVAEELPTFIELEKNGGWVTCEGFEPFVFVPSPDFRLFRCGAKPDPVREYSRDHFQFGNELLVKRAFATQPVVVVLAKREFVPREISEVEVEKARASESNENVLKTTEDSYDSTIDIKYSLDLTVLGMGKIEIDSIQNTLYPSPARFGGDLGFDADPKKQSPSLRFEDASSEIKIKMAGKPLKVTGDGAGVFQIGARDIAGFVLQPLNVLQLSNGTKILAFPYFDNGSEHRHAFTNFYGFNLKGDVLELNLIDQVMIFRD